jgi:micrococcal nuclease
MKLSLAVLTTAIALSAFPALSGSMTDFVTHVRDGDTVVVGQQPIRLNGISAPERNEDGGDEATAFMKRLVLGKKVTCVDNGKTTHDRLVAQCYLDGKDIGRLIIAAGLARDCPRYSGGRYVGDETEASRRLPFPRYCKVR